MILLNVVAIIILINNQRIKQSIILMCSFFAEFEYISVFS